MSEAAADALRGKLKRVDLGVCDYFPHAGGAPPRCAYTRPTLPPEEIGRRLGAALLAGAAESFDVPMELVP
jgi:hypothetical protein